MVPLTVSNFDNVNHRIYQRIESLWLKAKPEHLYLEALRQALLIDEDSLNPTGTKKRPSWFLLPILCSQAAGGGHGVFRPLVPSGGSQLRPPGQADRDRYLPGHLSQQLCGHHRAGTVARLATTSGLRRSVGHDS